MKNDGILGEAKALTYFIAEGYDVFNQFGGKAPFDLVVHKDNGLQRVSVKSVSYSRDDYYEVQLKTVRPNRTENVIHMFDNTSCDILFVYIVPEDRIVIYNVSDITSKSIVRIRKLAESGNALVLKTSEA